MLACGSALLDYVSIEAPDHIERLDTLLEVLYSDDAPQVLAMWDGEPNVDDCHFEATMRQRLVRAAVGRKHRP